MSPLAKAGCSQLMRGRHEAAVAGTAPHPTRRSTHSRAPPPVDTVGLQPACTPYRRALCYWVARATSAVHVRRRQSQRRHAARRLWCRAAAAGAPRRAMWQRAPPCPPPCVRWRRRPGAARGRCESRVRSRAWPAMQCTVVRCSSQYECMHVGRGLLRGGLCNARFACNVGRGLLERLLSVVLAEGRLVGVGDGFGVSFDFGFGFGAGIGVEVGGEGRVGGAGGAVLTSQRAPQLASKRCGLEAESRHRIGNRHTCHRAQVHGHVHIHVHVHVRVHVPLTCVRACGWQAYRRGTRRWRSWPRSGRGR